MASFLLGARDGRWSMSMNRDMSLCPEVQIQVPRCRRLPAHRCMHQCRRSKEIFFFLGLVFVFVFVFARSWCAHARPPGPVDVWFTLHPSYRLLFPFFMGFMWSFPLLLRLYIIFLHLRFRTCLFTFAFCFFLSVSVSVPVPSPHFHTNHPADSNHHHTYIYIHIFLP